MYSSLSIYFTIRNIHVQKKIQTIVIEKSLKILNNFHHTELYNEQLLYSTQNIFYTHLNFKILFTLVII